MIQKVLKMCKVIYKNPPNHSKFSTMGFQQRIDQLVNATTSFFHQRLDEIKHVISLVGAFKKRIDHLIEQEIDVDDWLSICTIGVVILLVSFVLSFLNVHLPIGFLLVIDGKY